MVWYSHLLKNFPQFVIHTIRGFGGIINKAKVDVFLELSCFFDDPTNVGNLISGSSALSPAAKSFQLCLTLCDPIDGSPPGSSVHGIFQARVLEWGAITFSDIIVPGVYSIFYNTFT